MDSIESLELSVTPEELCRTCLAAVDRNQLKPIFCSEILDGKIVPFPKVIQLATGEELVRDEKLPSGVCVECKVKLRDLFIFVTKVRNSKNLLYDIFNVAKPEAKPIEGGVNAATKVIKKCAEVQTDASGPVRKLRSSRQLVERGTQCDDNSTVRTKIPAAVCNVQTQTNGEQDGVVASGESHHRLELIQTFAGEEVTLNGGDEEDCVSDIEELLQGENTLKLSKAPGDRSSFKEEQLDSADSSAEELKKGAVIEKKRETCLYCNYTAQSATFAKHLLVHQQTLELCFESIEYYRCGNCFTVFMSQEHMEEHFESSCSPVQSNDIVKHVDLSKHESFYQNGVDMCVPKFKTFTSAGDGMYRCFRCATVVDDFDAIRAHCTEHDLVDDDETDVDQIWETNQFDTVHVCGVCQGQFSDATFIRQHVYFHQTSYFCMYNCEHVSDDFGRLTRHLQAKHFTAPELQASNFTGTDEQQSGATQAYKCEHCKKVLGSEAALRKHVKSHARERKFACSTCSKRFTQKGDLVTHKRIHTNERPYRCMICDKAFRTLSHRRDHMSTHAEDNKFECEVCHKKFKAARILAGHRQLHTGIRPHTCEVCSKTFARKHHLKQHSRIHCKQ
ncbi:zinc finger protein 530-like [Anopheles albimanus]|uniref:Uncharacterized protein n=1 Tax=Anopheles albimanus TaxID=7167 RepID=A0A182FTG8_ANOAL|nr:zinc finger protein 530-like [Anopheles albimanus]